VMEAVADTRQSPMNSAGACTVIPNRFICRYQKYTSSKDKVVQSKSIQTSHPYPHPLAGRGTLDARAKCVQRTKSNPRRASPSRWATMCIRRFGVGGTRARLVYLLCFVYFISCALADYTASRSRRL
jgi:hypothetical protein